MPRRPCFVLRGKPGGLVAARIVQHLEQRAVRLAVVRRELQRPPEARLGLRVATLPEQREAEAVVQRVRAGIDRALSEAEKVKAEIDEVLKKQPKDDLRTNLGKVRRGIAALSVISPVPHTMATMPRREEAWLIDVRAPLFQPYTAQVPCAD